MSADLVAVEPGVDGDQDAARGGDGEVRLQHRRDVRAEKRDPVIFAQAGGAQGGGEAIDPLRELPVAVRRAPMAMHDGGLVGEDGGAAAQEADGRELGAVDLLWSAVG